MSKVDKANSYARHALAGLVVGAVVGLILVMNGVRF